MYLYFSDHRRFCCFAHGTQAGYGKLSVTTVLSLNEMAHAKKGIIFIACVTMPNNCEKRVVVVLKY